MTEAITDTTLIERNPLILFNDFDDGLMMMNIDSGHYFDVDEVGGRIWALLETPMTVEQICESLVREFDVALEQCRAETMEFVGELAAKSLVTLKSA